MSWSFDARKILCAVAFACVLHSRAAGLTVQASTEAHCTTPPGKVVTLGWRLANETSRDTTVSERYELPAGWRMTTFADATAPIVAAGGKLLRFAAVVVPAQAPAGDYRITGHWRAGGETSEISETLVVSVQPQEKLAVAVKKAPGIAVAGETYSVDYLVFNRGNSELRVRPVATVTAPGTVKIDDAGLVLSPGGTGSLRAQVTVPSTVNRPSVLSLELALKAGEATANAVTLTEIYPKPIADAPVAWPARLETRWIHRPGGRDLLQAGLSGSAAGDNGRRFDFLIRTAGDPQEDLFGEPECYAFSYHGPKWSWQAGNQVFTLSPLTARPQYGSGAGFSFSPGNKWTAGAFAMHSRESASVDKQIGGFIRFEPAADLTVGVNLISKTPGYAEDFAGEKTGTASVMSRYRMGPSMEAEVEIGFSPVRPDDASGSAWGGRAEVWGLVQSVSYKISAERQGEAFFGALRGADSLAASINVPLTKNVDAHAEYRSQSYVSPYAEPGERRLSNQLKEASAGVSWRFNPTLEFGLAGRDADRSFAFVDSPTRYRESAGELSVQLRRGRFLASSVFTAGRVKSLAGDVSDGPLWRFNQSLSWIPGERGSVSVHWGEGNDPYSASAVRTRTLSVTGALNLGTRWRATANAGGNFYDAREARRYSYAFATTEYRFSKGQTIGVRFGWNNRRSDGAESPTWALSYSRPLGLPGPALSRHGSIAGTLRDAGSGRPVSRAVVSLNDNATVTDEQGRFRFNDLQAGDYQLAVAARSLPADSLLRDDKPLAIQLARAEQRQVEIGTERAARLVVEVKPADVVFPGAEMVSLAGLTVTLRSEDGQTERRELTDANGCAVFQGLPSGRWRARIDPSVLPHRYRVNDPAGPVEVAAAADYRTQLTLAYDAPTIRWIAEAGR